MQEAIGTSGACCRYSFPCCQRILCTRLCVHDSRHASHNGSRKISRVHLVPQNQKKSKKKEKKRKKEKKNKRKKENKRTFRPWAPAPLAPAPLAPRGRPPPGRPLPGRLHPRPLWRPDPLARNFFSFFKKTLFLLFVLGRGARERGGPRRGGGPEKEEEEQEEEKQKLVIKDRGSCELSARSSPKGLWHYTPHTHYTHHAHHTHTTHTARATRTATLQRAQTRLFPFAASARLASHGPGVVMSVERKLSIPNFVRGSRTRPELKVKAQH